ncbi:MAG: ArsR family transcriptional regulator [Actinobacteria bacterium]|nr:ArsR family transcriptional regulator [Actinomycetota bacterium]
MARKSQDIQDFIVNAIPEHPKDVVARAMERFGLSRQAIFRHVNILMKSGLVRAEGKTKQRTYKLAITERETLTVPILNLEEDRLWRDNISALLSSLPGNMFHIWHYGFTEMVNNAVDHSNGKMLTVILEKTAATTNMLISDDGIGIFKKIKMELGLEDERHAILELAKGKLTTDPSRHTGEGIFFSSRMFDHYRILSGGVFFSHVIGEEEDWILEREIPKEGTVVFMSNKNVCPRTAKEIFDKYLSKKEDYGFNKTVVPVRLLKHGLEQLISRSQAKRLLVRFERFKVVILDFKGVDTIGQAFADEIFRVFSSEHPDVRLIPVNATSEVKKIIRRAKPVKSSPHPSLFDK